MTLAGWRPRRPWQLRRPGTTSRVALQHRFSPVGDYSATVEIIAAGAANSPQTVPVNVHVVPAGMSVGTVRLLRRRPHHDGSPPIGPASPAMKSPVSVGRPSRSVAAPAPCRPNARSPAPARMESSPPKSKSAAEPEPGISSGAFISMIPPVIISPAGMAAAGSRAAGSPAPSPPT